MRDLRDRLHDVDLVEPPDVWGQALRRGPSPQLADEQPRARRMATIVVALAIAVAAGGLLVRSFRSSPVAPVPSTPAIVSIPDDPCALLTTAQIESATGDKVVSSGPIPRDWLKGPLPPDARTGCDFETDGPFGVIGVFTNPNVAQPTFESLASDLNAYPIDGLGDKAIVSGKSSIWVQVGQGFFAIGAQHGAGDEAVAMLTALANDALEGLSTGSQSSNPTTVPDFVGRNFLEAAVSASPDFHLVDTKYKHSSDVPNGTILRQRPLGGTEVVFGQRILVVVSIRSSGGIPTCAPNGKPWASSACPESVWLRKVIAAAGAKVIGFETGVEPQPKSAFLVSFDGYTFSMGAVSREDLKKMGGYFSMGEFPAGMQGDGMVSGVSLAGNVKLGHWAWTTSGFTVEIYPAGSVSHVPQRVVEKLIQASQAVG